MRNVKQLVLISMFSAIIIVSKEFLATIPNVELVTTLFIIYALNFKLSDSLFICLIFNLVQMVLYGTGDWLIGYFVVWPLLIILCNRFKKYINNADKAAIIALVFGLSFGMFFSIYYFIISIQSGWVYYVRGIPYDIVHGISNYIIMILLYEPLNYVVDKVKFNDSMKTIQDKEK